ncbi:hypothetical protein M8C21_018303, partial [Ambrosia artemisiifolia]
ILYDLRRLALDNHHHITIPIGDESVHRTIRLLPPPRAHVTRLFRRLWREDKLVFSSELLTRFFTSSLLATKRRLSGSQIPFIRKHVFISPIEQR